MYCVAAVFVFLFQIVLFINANTSWEILRIHNYYRHQLGAVRMLQIGWNANLAENAQRKANKCQYGLSNDREKEGAGETIWAHSTMNYSEAIRAWFVEDKRTCNHFVNSKCPYYAQVVWSETYQVGCGAAHCGFVRAENPEWKVITVCHYWPPANGAVSNKLIKAYQPAPWIVHKKPIQPLVPTWHKQTTPATIFIPTRVKISYNDKVAIINYHNWLRQTIGGRNLRQMQWNERLAETAQDHADHCFYRGSTVAENGGAGENLMMTNTLNYNSIISSWKDQSVARKCANMVDRTCSYYGQLVWPNTYMVGCGVTKCKKIAHGNRHVSYKYMIACHYWSRALIPTRSNNRVKAFDKTFFGKSSCSNCQAEGQQLFRCQTDGLCASYTKVVTPAPTQPPVTMAWVAPQRAVQPQLTWTPVKQQGNQILLRRWMSNAARNMLLDEHNNYRRKAPAKNMRKMIWSSELERTAQMHSDRCQFGHSTSRSRGGDYGENIWAGSTLDVMDVVWRWYIEVDDVHCQCPHSYKHCCGHYTQVVWADSFLLGCGISECSGLWDMGTSRWRFTVVCHYWPKGNILIANPAGLFPVQAFSWRNHKEEACTQCKKEVGKRLTWNFKYCDKNLCSTGV